MMYHCFVLSSVMVPTARCPCASVSAAERLKRPAHELRQANINQIKVNPEQHRRQNHDNRRRPDFATRRPRDTAELAAHFRQEAPAASEPPTDLLTRFL